ncbi:MAG: nuclease-related domain-containing protein, partial [Gammaproteobacteria bacterium]|nr:nuclease-related domain-containing protein [Gammaproteobacteria bacterium]
KLLEPILTFCFLPYLFSHLLNNANFETRMWVGAVLLVPSVWAIHKIYHLYKQIRRLKLELEAETFTGQELNTLMRTGAWVYHDVPFNDETIGHIVVSKAGIFIVETSAVSSPRDDKGVDAGVNDAKVIVKDESLVFPHLTTAEPIEQAQRHAKQVTTLLFRKTGIEYPVYPIIALPGWSIVDACVNKKGFLVVNPKRGAGLERYMGNERIAIDDVNTAFTVIDAVARSVSTHTNIPDPDAKKNDSSILNRKPHEQGL